MKFDGVRLPAEYTDLILMLARIPAKYHNMILEIKTYSDKDLLITNRNDGELFTFCDGSPLKLLGSRLSISETKINDDRLWDVCVACNFDKYRFSKERYLKSLEEICEDHGYTLIDVEAGKLYFEIMDRVIFNGYRIDSTQALCYDFNLDYDEICSLALKKKQSTHKILEQKVTVTDMDRMYSDVFTTNKKTIEKSDFSKRDKEIAVQKQSNNLEGVSIFNDSKNSKS